MAPHLHSQLGTTAAMASSLGTCWTPGAMRWNEMLGTSTSYGVLVGSDVAK